MNLQSILVLLVMIVCFVAAVVFIAKNGGWNSEEGCHGNCAECGKRAEHCPDEKPKTE